VQIEKLYVKGMFILMRKNVKKLSISVYQFIYNCLTIFYRFR